jgi:hypothetical protein|nr:MAG TPA: hypothetical protein [Bacteriophage sp.]
MINNPYQQQMMTYTPGYNAYPYNPMQRFQEQQLPQQPVQQVPQQQNLQIQAGINGRMVAAVEQIAANDVPMDGSVAFFPKQDLTEIYAKQWGADGSIKTVVYKPYTEPKNSQGMNNTENIENLKIDLSDESTAVFMQKFDEIFNKFDELENKMCKTSTSQRKTSTLKKEGGVNE